MTVRAGRLWTVLVLAVAMTLAIVGCSATRISIDPDVVPRMTPSQVADIVGQHIHLDEQLLGRVVAPIRIVSIAGTRASRTHQFEPSAAIDASGSTAVVWVVRAQGTFTTNRGRGNELPAAASGYYIINDSDGSVTGFGFP